jgi:hypothetical protein
VYRRRTAEGSLGWPITRGRVRSRYRANRRDKGRDKDCRGREENFGGIPNVEVFVRSSPDKLGQGRRTKVGNSFRVLCVSLKCTN